MFFRDEVLRHVNKIPERPSEIHRRVLNDYGSVALRSVERALRWLFDNGDICWVPYKGYWMTEEKHKIRLAIRRESR